MGLSKSTVTPGNMLIYANKRNYVTARVCRIDLNTPRGPCTLVNQPNDNASLWMSGDEGSKGVILTLPAAKGRIIVEVNSCLCHTPQSTLRQTIAASIPLSSHLRFRLSLNGPANC